MVKLPSAIIKKYGITKRAWAEFRKTKAGKSRQAKHAKKRKSAGKITPHKLEVRSSNPKKESEKMEHKSKKSKAVAVGHKAKKKIRAVVSSRPGQIMLMAVEASAGAVVTSLIVNKAPVISKQSKTVKSLVQAVVGVSAVMFLKNKHAKSAGAGAVIAAVMSMAKEYLKVEPLAGPSMGARTLSPSELNRLTGMGMPLNGSMGIPLNGSMGANTADAPASAGFNRGGFGS